MNPIPLRLSCFPLNSEPAGEEETRPVKTFMALPTIPQEYNGGFYDATVYNPPPLLHPPTNETNKVLMFKGLNTCSSRQIAAATSRLGDGEPFPLIKPNSKCASRFSPAVTSRSPHGRQSPAHFLRPITACERVRGGGIFICNLALTIREERDLLPSPSAANWEAGFRPSLGLWPVLCWCLIVCILLLISLFL